MKCAKQPSHSVSVGVQTEARDMFGACKANLADASTSSSLHPASPLSPSSSSSCESGSEYEPESEESEDEDSSAESNLGSSPEHYIVSRTSLDKMLNFCPECGGTVMEREDTCCAGVLTVNIACSNGCTTRWRSQSTLTRDKSLCKHRSV